MRVARSSIDFVASRNACFSSALFGNRSGLYTYRIKIYARLSNGGGPVGIEKDVQETSFFNYGVVNCAYCIESLWKYFSNLYIYILFLLIV